jgi:hypothetical protein
MPGEGAWAQSPPRARPPQRARQGELVRDMLPPARATRLPAREVLVDRPHRGPARQREPPLGMQEMEWAESHVSWLGDSSTARSRRLSGGYAVREDQPSLTGRAACRIAGSNAVTTSRLLMNESVPLSYASRRVGSWHLGQDPIPTE